MKKKILNIVKILFFLSLGLFFIFYFLGKLTVEEKQDILASFKSINFIWFFGALAINILSHILRALRWRLMFKPLGYLPRFKITFSAVMIGYMANLAVPRLGEFVRCGILDRYEKIPMQKSLGTVVTERVVDLLTFGFFVLLAFLVELHVVKSYILENSGENISSNKIQWAVIIFLMLIFTSVMFYFLFRKKLESFSLYKKIKRIFSEFWEGILSIFKLHNPYLFILYSLLIWGLYLMGVYFIFFCLPETTHLGMKAALLTLVLGAIGNMITPGGIGLYPILFSKSLHLYLISKPVGYALGWISWVVQQVGCIIIGLVSLIGLSFVKNEKK